LKQRGHVNYLPVFIVCVLIIGITGDVTAVNDTAEAIPEIVLQVSPVLGAPSDDPSGLISDDTADTGDPGNSAGESPAFTDQNGELDPDRIEPGVPSPDPVSGVEPDSETTQDNPDQGLPPADDGSGEADGPGPEEPADMTGELPGDEEIPPAVPPEAAPLVASVDDTNTTIISPEPAPFVTPVDDTNTTMVNQEPVPLVPPVDDTNTTMVSQEPVPLVPPVDDTNTTMISQEPAPLVDLADGNNTLIASQEPAPIVAPVDGNNTLPMPPEGAIILPNGNQTLIAGNGTPDLIITDTNATILDPNLFSIGSQENLTLFNDNATPLLDAGCAGNQTGSGFNLTWTEGLTDPPLNATNLQGAPGSQYWEINGTTGSGYYPLDLIGLVTSAVCGIWIHDVSDIVLDGLGQTLQYDGPANQGATGVVIDGATSNIQIKNLTILGWDTGIAITGADNVYVTDNTVISGNKNSGGTTGSGIEVRDSTNVYIVSDLQAGSVRVTNNGRDGISYSNVTGGGINNTWVADNGNNGVNLSYSQWITVDNVTATLNNNGMLLDNASHNTITRSNASMNRNSGITLLSSDYNNLTGNTANGNYGSSGGDIGGNGYGMYLSGSNYNNLFRNNASGNSGGSTQDQYFGIWIHISISDDMVELVTSFRNGLCGGSGYGIYLTGSNSNNLTENIADGNYGGSSNGDIKLITVGNISGNAELKENTRITDSLNGGNGYGIFIAGSGGNNVSANTATGNHGGSNGGFNFSYTLNTTGAGSSDLTITIQNVSNGGSGHGIYLDGSSGNDLSDNRVTGNYGDLTFENGADCIFNVATGSGGTLSTDIAFLNVNSGNSGYGIYLSGSDGNNLSGNTADENYGGLTNGTSPECIFTITNAEGANATTDVDLQNVDTANAGYGIRLSGSDDNTVTGNTANQNYGGSGANGGNGGNGYGIWLLLSDNTNISGNTASNNYGGRGTIGGNGYGISLLLSDYTNISGNTASNNYGGSGSNSFSVSGGNGGNGYGISLLQSDYTNISGNTASNNYGGSGGYGFDSGGNGGNGYGISLLQSNYTNISGNTATYNHGGHGSSDTISGNGGNGGNGYGIYLNGLNYNTISGNTATYNHGGSGGYSFTGSGGTGGTGYGILLQLSDYTNISGNTASGNSGGSAARGISGGTGGTGYGISLLQSNYTSLSVNTVYFNNGGNGGSSTGTGENGGNGGNGYGISLLQSDYNTLSGNTASVNSGGGSGEGGNGGNGYGIYLNRSHLNTLSGNTVYFNYGENGSIGGNGGNGYGISLQLSDYNTLSGNSAAYNYGGNGSIGGNGGNGYGISLLQSDYTNISGNAGSYNRGGFGAMGGNGYGIRLEQSDYNNISGNFAKSNYGGAGEFSTGIGNGMYLTQSSHNNLIGNNASRNSYTGILIHQSNSNNLTGNRITDNNGFGIIVSDSEGNNTIYNNYFNNSQNALVTSTLEAPAPGPAQVIPDHWSVSPFPGSNIIGGSYIGGNYWGTPDGTGWSQTHPDIGNGFTIPYDIPGDGSNVDLHPLTLNPPVPPEYPDPYILPVHPTLQWNAAFISNSIPSAMCACSSTPVTVTVNNTGTTGWLQDDVELGAYNDGAKLFSPVLVPLVPDTFVSPGHTYTFSFTLIAPCSPGTYAVEYRLVKNNGEWFGDVLSIVIDVNDCGQVTNLKTGKQLQTFRTSPVYPASDLIAQKGTGLTISPADSRLSGGSGFSSMQSEALGQFAGTTASPDTPRSRSGAFLEGFLTSLTGTLFSRR